MVILLYRWVYIAILPCLLTAKTNDSVRFHPFYVSVIEINHNAKDQILEVSCKIFTDDFEKTLEQQAKTKIDLSDQKEKSNTDKLIADYIPRHLQLKVDGRAVNMQFIGSEKENEATWSYFQVNQVSSLKKIEITSDLLYQSFDSQINIIHVTVNGNTQSTKLSRPDIHASFEF